jgi:hypothetical protein
LRVRAAPGAFPITIFKSRIETDELFVADALPSVDRIMAFSGAENRQLRRRLFFTNAVAAVCNCVSSLTPSATSRNGETLF